MNSENSPSGIPSGFIKLQDKIDELVNSYLDSHPDFVNVAQDKDAALKGKSAADTKSELAAYPWVAAVAVHEEAHKLYKTGNSLKKVQARKLSEAVHSRTGIDIHPGAEIGKNCFIDHGTGVVVGETAKIGDNTLIYHGVTLGAYGYPTESNPRKLAHRHPQIGSDCTLSVGVNVLGKIRIGNSVTISPNAILSGNNLIVGDNVSIGRSVQIGDNNQIAAGVKIGTGAVIPKGMGLITEDVPPHSQVIRGQGGKLQTISLDDSIKNARLFAADIGNGHGSVMR